MPMSGPRLPTHFTDVPVKINVARSATPLATAAVPPLHAWVVSVMFHPAVNVADEAFSS